MRTRYGFGHPPMPRWVGGGGTSYEDKYPPWEVKETPEGKIIPPRYIRPRLGPPGPTPLPQPGEHTTETPAERLERILNELAAGIAQGENVGESGMNPYYGSVGRGYADGNVVWVRAEEERLRELV